MEAAGEDVPLRVQVLQKAVDVALAVLRDIEDFSESLRGRELSVARGESPTGGELATPATAARKLRSLIGGWRAWLLGRRAVACGVEGTACRCDVTYALAFAIAAHYGCLHPP